MAGACWRPFFTFHVNRLMSTLTSDILDRLRGADGFLSGGELCSEMGITRSAVWKHISLLRKKGYSIEAVSGRGYRLSGSPGLPVPEEIQPFLSTARFGRTMEYHEMLESTNQRAKTLAREGAAEGCVVIADSQTGGRGRMGREWMSPPASNLYFSVILRPPVPPLRLSQIPLLTAAAIHRTVEAMVDNASAMVKWPNDILIDGRKVCGILCEMETEPDMAHFVIAGIGINVNLREIPADLEGIATSLRIESGNEWSRPEILAALLNCFEPMYDEWLEAEDLGDLLPYLDRYAWLKGREVSVERYKGSVSGKVTGLGRSGELLLMDDDGTEHAITSGEATIRKEA